MSDLEILDMLAARLGWEQKADRVWELVGEPMTLDDGEVLPELGHTSLLSWNEAAVGVNVLVGNPPGGTWWVGHVMSFRDIVRTLADSGL